MLRKAIAVLAFFGTYFIVWMLMLMTLGDQVWIGMVEGSSSVAVMAGLGAVILGGLGFVAGFFGPMIFAPEANQGPLLGLFITGPAGVVVGAIAGAVYARRR